MVVVKCRRCHLGEWQNTGAYSQPTARVGKELSTRVSSPQYSFHTLSDDPRPGSCGVSYPQNEGCEVSVCMFRLDLSVKWLYWKYCIYISRWLLCAALQRWLTRAGDIDNFIRLLSRDRRTRCSRWMSIIAGEASERCNEGLPLRGKCHRVGGLERTLSLAWLWWMPGWGLKVTGIFREKVFGRKWKSQKFNYSAVYMIRFIPGDSWRLFWWMG